MVQFKRATGFSCIVQFKRATLNRIFIIKMESYEGEANALSKLHYDVLNQVFDKLTFEDVFRLNDASYLFSENANVYYRKHCARFTYKVDKYKNVNNMCRLAPFLKDLFILIPQYYDSIKHQKILDLIENCDQLKALKIGFNIAETKIYIRRTKRRIYVRDTDSTETFIKTYISAVKNTLKKLVLDSMMVIKGPVLDDLPTDLTSLSLLNLIFIH